MTTELEGGVAIDPALAGRLRAARRVVVLTGAGVSAESGIPTFRGARDSFWSRYDPMKLGSVDGFLDDPELVWRWYAMRRDQVRAAQPNAGHLALARLERLVPEFALATQNVDDLHERAGSRNVLRLHGSILENRCFDEERVLADDEVLCDTMDAPGAPMGPPRCRQCGGLVRPGVVWFGEALPIGVFERALEAVVACDVCLVVGTSATVHPAAGLVSYLPDSALLVVVNPDPTDHCEYACHFLQAPAGTALPALVDAAFGSRH